MAWKNILVTVIMKTIKTVHKICSPRRHNQRNMRNIKTNIILLVEVKTVQLLHILLHKLLYYEADVYVDK